MDIQLIQTRILTIRGQRVMLDVHLAELYEVETRALKQAVKRNPARFPVDFMFELTVSEVDQMVSQFVIPSKSYFGGALPFAFTEQGVAMLSSVLKSVKAIEINIAIVRAFVVLRQYLTDYKDLKEQISAIEQGMNTKFADVYQALITFYRLKANVGLLALRILFKMMKTNLKYELISWRSDEDVVFIAEVPELPGCAADGETYQEAVTNVEVIIREWIETAQSMGREIPRPKGRLLFA